MFHERNKGVRNAGAVLESLRGELVAARARLDALLDTIREHRHDPRRAREVGLALDVIARERLHRLHGHTDIAVLLATELGISRTTAHRWRTAAREAAREQPERPKKLPPDRPRPQVEVTSAARAEARALKARLRRRGVENVRVEVFVRDGEAHLRVELPADQARRLG